MSADLIGRFGEAKLSFGGVFVAYRALKPGLHTFNCCVVPFSTIEFLLVQLGDWLSISLVVVKRIGLWPSAVPLNRYQRQLSPHISLSFFPSFDNSILTALNSIRVG